MRIACNHLVDEPDPNGDLIGQSVELNGERWTVTSTWAHSVQCVVLETEDGSTIIRAAGLVRRRIELTEGGNA